MIQRMRMRFACFIARATYKHSEYVIFMFLWPCIVSKVWREKNQQDLTIRCLLLTSISTCLGHHYAHLQENKGPVTAFGVLFWFCWMWLVAVVGRCLVRCEHYEGFCSTSVTTTHYYTLLHYYTRSSHADEQQMAVVRAGKLLLEILSYFGA